MSCVVDASVLLGAAVSTWHGHEACLSLIEGLSKGPGTWYFTPEIFDDLYRYGTSSGILEPPWSPEELRPWIERLRQSPFLRELVKTIGHQSVVDWILRAYPGLPGELLRLVEVAALMREHGVIRIYTIDGRFRMFPFLQAVNPLRLHE
jgi:predicted nucleic acid-binding protein